MLGKMALSVLISAVVYVYAYNIASKVLHVIGEKLMSDDPLPRKLAKMLGDYFPGISDFKDAYASGIGAAKKESFFQWVASKMGVGKQGMERVANDVFKKEIEVVRKAISAASIPIIYMFINGTISIATTVKNIKSAVRDISNKHIGSKYKDLAKGLQKLNSGGHSINKSDMIALHNTIDSTDFYTELKRVEVSDDQPKLPNDVTATIQNKLGMNKELQDAGVKVNDITHVIIGDETHIEKTVNRLSRSKNV